MSAQIRLLGPPEVVVDGESIDFDTRKALAVLAFLALQERASRDTLTGLLWSESAPDRARATLRRTLSSVRKGVGSERIDADRHEVRLTDIVADVTRFKDAVAETRTHGHDQSEPCAACVGLLDEAAQLYGGDFLEGFFVGGAPEFEEWQRSTAEELRLMAGEVLSQLARARAAQGRYTEAIAAVSRWIDLDQLHEPAHRLLMLLRAWAGDRPGAMQSYRDFVAILDRELAVPPLAETTQLYEAILDEDLPPAPAPREGTGPAEPDRPAEADLLDRVEELGHLRDLVARSRESGVVACVEGAPWMGKTRLLEEVSDTTASGHTLLMGRAFRTEQTLPHGVVAQLLTSAVRNGLPASLPPWILGQLTLIVPSVAPGEHDRDPDPFGELRLMEAIHQLFLAMSLERPLLIVVDDAQWIDPASAALMSYVAQRVDTHPILILMSRRDVEDLHPAIEDVISRAETIRLMPLTADDLPTTTPNAHEVISATGGIPLLVAEHLNERHDSGEVERYLRLRMDGISDLGMQVLSTAAVLSGSCSFSLLKRVSGRSDEEVVDAMDELMTAGLLREVPSTETVTLAMDALETMTYASLSLARRRLLHKRVAESLADMPRVRNDVRQTAQVASQFQSAGDTRAAGWFRLAGDLARSSYANQEAAEFYETALALGDEDVGELHLSIAELAMIAGDYQKALASLTTAAARSEGETLGRVEHRLGEVQRLLGRFDLAAEYFERSLANHPQPMHVYADWALLADRVGDSALAHRLGQQALAAIDDREQETASRVHSVNGAIAVKFDEAIAHLDRALELANGNDVARMAALNNKAHALADAGDYDDAIDLVLQAIDLSSRTGHRHHEATLRDFLADLYHRSGREQLSRDAQTTAMHLFAELGTDSLEPELWQLSRW
jgi:DNA-binding SARP family transcriptional activator